MADQAPISWATRLGSKGVSKTKLEYIPPTIINGEPVIHIQSTEFVRIQNRNENLVIGSFITKRSSFEFVQDIVKRAWKPKNKVTIKLYGQKSFSFEFDDENDRAQALEYGNFHIASQIFLVRPWKLFVEADLKNLETLPIWVIFKNMPEELWDKKGFSRVASAVGEPLFTDRKTESKTRAEYARICIEVKATSNFPTVVPIVVDKKKVFKVAVEYNWRPPRCKLCKIFGHCEETCSKQQQNNQPTVWIQKETAQTTSHMNASTNQESNNAEAIHDPTHEHSHSHSHSLPLPPPQPSASPPPNPHPPPTSSAPTSPPPSD
ncbi:hypothetical protein ACHQM5_007483 [Ranunculus cassubicifolius]